MVNKPKRNYSVLVSRYVSMHLISCAFSICALKKQHKCDKKKVLCFLEVGKKGGERMVRLIKTLISKYNLLQASTLPESPPKNKE